MSVAKVPFDRSKYIMEGEKEKLQYPKPPKSKLNEYISPPEMKEELQYPTKRTATETFQFKLNDVMESGTKEKLVFDKPVKFPDEGDVTPVVDTKTPDKYISEGLSGDIQKAKTFTVDVSQDVAKVDTKKYFLEFDKAKPFQKQFSRKVYAANVYTLTDVIGYTFASFLKWAAECPSEFEALLDQVKTHQFYPRSMLVEATLEKNAGRSLEEWLRYLKEKKVPRRIRRQFRHIWKSVLERGGSEENAARAAIDILPKEVLEKPTKFHGKEKTGPIKSASLDDEIKRKQEEISKYQEELVRLQKELADLQAKKSEELKAAVS